MMEDLNNINAYDFDLPEELIAQTPIKERDHSRLLVLDTQTKTYQDKVFTDIIDELNAGDVLVMNDTRVLPARLHGTRQATGAHLEVLLLQNIEGDRWETLMKPARKARVGDRILFGDGRLQAVVCQELDQGGRILEFEYDGIFLEVLEELGEMPLPPYIKEKLQDSERYQTVYARENGSAAAPTAGLHFTNDLLEKIKTKGVELAFVTLHVGLGTFRPVQTDDISEHVMHSEYYHVSHEVAEQINRAKARGNRIIAVGTTSIRTLESVAALNNGKMAAQSGWTDIFIKPGFKFQIVDALSTNFHLPKSTLIMLVSALGGREFILEAYAHAVEEKYRFFSFGDAMFIK